MDHKIFVTLSTFAQQGDEPLNILKESGIPFIVNESGKRITKEELIAQGKDCTGVVAGVEPYDKEVFDHLPNLQCISRCGVGIDSINLAMAKERGIVVCNTPDVIVPPVAELTVAFAFDLLRNVTQYTLLMRGKKWQRMTGFLLQGKKVGVLGLGRIGKRVAEMMLALGADVYGADIAPDHAWVEKAGVKLVSLNELLKISDILSIHLSFSADNPFQLGKEEIAMMKQGSFVINVARGNFLDETALHEALKNGHLAGAALDVYSQEPYTGLLCECDNVILTPHVATLTKESRLQMETEAVKNLVDYLSDDK